MRGHSYRGVTDAALNEHHEQSEQSSSVSVEKRHETEETAGTTKEAGDLISHDPTFRFFAYDPSTHPRVQELYRLVLRTGSPSILRTRPATPRLRAMWRPTFDVAARVARGVRRPPQAEGGARVVAQAREWLNTWGKQSTSVNTSTPSMSFLPLSYSMTSLSTAHSVCFTDMLHSAGYTSDATGLYCIERNSSAGGSEGEMKSFFWDQDEFVALLLCMSRLGGSSCGINCTLS